MFPKGLTFTYKNIKGPEFLVLSISTSSVALSFQ